MGLLSFRTCWGAWSFARLDSDSSEAEDADLRRWLPHSLGSSFLSFLYLSQGLSLGTKKLMGPQHRPPPETLQHYTQV